jgi:biotin synthase-like enzyme
MDGRVSWRDSPEHIAEHAARWRDEGATHLSVNTMGAGLRTVDDHLRALEAVAEVLKPAGE